MTSGQPKQAITLVGHPFAPIGKGRELRVTAASFSSVACSVKIRDVWQHLEPEPDQALTLAPQLTQDFGQINIFHLNGDEIEPALAHMGRPTSGTNVVFPAWELARYPECWAQKLAIFDEIWTPSQFVADSIRLALSKPVVAMPLAAEFQLSSFIGRRYFGLPEADYTYLFMFDCRSYIARKNPHAVVNAFRQVLKARPYGRVRLAIKIHGADAELEALTDFIEGIADIKERITVFTKTMTENETHNLIRCCDAFVSLHRSEGFGFAMAEAMYLGIPVVATGYSGNMDYMSRETALLVDYRLVQLNEGDYPYGEGQVWAEADCDQAAAHMIALADDPSEGRRLGRLASRHTRTFHSLRAMGLRCVDRLNARAERSLACHRDVS